jgi:hypothetical protein
LRGAAKHRLDGGFAAPNIVPTAADTDRTDGLAIIDDGKTALARKVAEPFRRAIDVTPYDASKRTATARIGIE